MLKRPAPLAEAPVAAAAIPRVRGPDPLDDVEILSLEELRALDCAADRRFYARCARWFAENAVQFNDPRRWIDVDGRRPHMCLSILGLVEDVRVGDETARETLCEVVDTLRAIAFERSFNLHFRVYDTPKCRVEVYRKVPKAKK